MIRLYGSDWSRGELLRRAGTPFQFAGVQRSRLVEGVERDVEILEFRTGTGFSFNVIPSRGMIIGRAEYRGTPLAWLSGTGRVAPELSQEGDAGWRRSFWGGLLTTCGLVNVGSPCVDDGETLGQHGRIANVPATSVLSDARWEGSQLTLSAQGTVREMEPGRHDLALTRTITAKVGENRLYVYDIVENVGYTDAPFMFLYHINVGFPVLDEGAELIVPTRGVTPRDDVAAAAVADRFRFEQPTAGFQEQVFYHDAIADENRHVWAALINKRFDDGQGIGIYVRYHQSQFPNLVQWKMMGEGSYAVGIEPSNCLVEGRAVERERGTLEFIEAGGRRHFETEIGVLTGQDEIQAFEERVARVRSNGQS